MNKTTAAIVWLVGFIILSVILTNTHTGKEGFFFGFFSGLIWTALVLAMTKRKTHV